MRKTPPPLSLLPAFEAAARLLSFKKAASELMVTPSAISQQIKALENRMDVNLFERRPRAVSLTPTGHAFHRVVADTLAQYRDGYEAFQQSHNRPVIRLSSSAQISIDILIPSLSEFRALHPGIDLRIEISGEPVDFEEKWIDASIRVGDGGWSGAHSQRLCEVAVTGVVSPALRASQPISTAAPFQGLTVIHPRLDSYYWDNAASLLGLDLSGNPVLYFENNHAALTAAESGLGVALGLRPLINARIQRGSLTPLTADARPLEQACYLAYRPGLEGSPALDALREWLDTIFARLTLS